MDRTRSKDAAGMWHQDRFQPLTAAILNLALNLLRVRRLGLYGVLFSSIFVTAAVEVPWLLRNLFSQLFPRKELWRYVASLLRLLSVIVLACLPNLIFLAVYHKKEELRNWAGILKLVKKEFSGEKYKPLGIYCITNRDFCKGSRFLYNICK